MNKNIYTIYRLMIGNKPSIDLYYNLECDPNRYIYSDLDNKKDMSAHNRYCSKALIKDLIRSKCG